MGNLLTHGQTWGADGQKPHIRLHMRVSLLDKMKPDNHMKSCAVNAADGWRKRNVWYTERSVRYVLKRVTVI